MKRDEQISAEESFLTACYEKEPPAAASGGILTEDSYMIIWVFSKAFYMKMPLPFIPPPRRGRDRWG
ncbi:MAG: hypothetical protein COZ70_06850 [Deltaproteobacteria bacterium CG_4_8_14_3_um_filter_51_11]|nr:MAG: hypothetical protein AUK25_08070 [Desulfobacteraceae bacterium CG2_30_51_40]PIW00918.1 MAG: hypothetical protein COW41_04030 [Deltaproteobacteria bacterium CG17_big_fil_post_rev_8_21_14_2_50_51_6]PIX19833.1 MAG: hypothetical protein COZ70_06850 [Deltaproteobacteria bacterium CG_4_8_14_3_um_filter_51_11]PIY23832.1 MAG: hypothetical protein COZ11_08785 [Deltaproteobacteria bacterium CG_4_10_14_3_um_filter_51_14]PJB39381.1 MAG: hypothetical protein CO107_00355 [Deltaproteobacteria bacteriu